MQTVFQRLDENISQKNASTTDTKSLPFYLAKVKSKCEQERDAKTKGLLLLFGVFVPQCEEDGSYSSKQCNPSTGYCWCVDGEGYSIEGTKTRSKDLNCSEGEDFFILSNLRAFNHYFLFVS